MGRGIDVYEDKDLYETFVKIYNNKPKPTFEFNQGSVTADSTIARVLYALSRKDIENKEILILGAEDDMIGLALALTKKPKRVVVLDIDQRLVDLDNEYARKLRLPLEAHCFDLRKPFPKKWLKRFDTFITEPSESVAAFKGFVLKGVAALKGPGSVGYFGYTLADSSLNKWYKIQKILLSHYLVITDILADFIRYEPFATFNKSQAFNESPIKSPQNKEWYFSHWYRVVSLDKFYGANDNLVNLKQDFYLDKEIVSD
jgi:predicted methyltransferase